MRKYTYLPKTKESLRIYQFSTLVVFGLLTLLIVGLQELPSQYIYPSIFAVAVTSVSIILQTLSLIFDVNERTTHKHSNTDLWFQRMKNWNFLIASWGILIGINLLFDWYGLNFYFVDELLNLQFWIFDSFPLTLTMISAVIVYRYKQMKTITQYVMPPTSRLEAFLALLLWIVGIVVVFLTFVVAPVYLVNQTSLPEIVQAYLGVLTAIALTGGLIIGLEKVFDRLPDPRKYLDKFSE